MLQEEPSVGHEEVPGSLAGVKAGEEGGGGFGNEREREGEAHRRENERSSLARQALLLRDVGLPDTLYCGCPGICHVKRATIAAVLLRTKEESCQQCNGHTRQSR